MHTDAIMALFAQAVDRQLITNSEAGKLDFIAFAERAKAHGESPGALLVWLLKNKRYDYITLAEEDLAAARLREYRNGPKDARAFEHKPKPFHDSLELTADDRLVEACVRVAKQNRGVEPFMLAREAKGWSRKTWDKALAAYEQKRWSQHHESCDADVTLAGAVGKEKGGFYET